MRSPSFLRRLPSARKAQSLIEILIALFIFLLGAIGLFSVIPVAMYQAGRATRNMRASVISDFALATLRAETNVQIPLSDGECVVSDTSSYNAATNQLNVKPTGTWVDGQWTGKGLYIKMLTGPAAGLARRIRVQTGSSDPVTLTLEGASFAAADEPQADDKCRVVALAFSSQPPDVTDDAGAAPRSGTIKAVEALRYDINCYPTNTALKWFLKRNPNPESDVYACLCTDQKTLHNNPWVVTPAGPTPIPASGGDANHLDFTGGLQPDAEIGRILVLQGGSGHGQVRTIVDNETSQFTVAPAFAPPPSSDTWFVVQANCAFILITSGKAAGRIYHLTNVIPGDEIKMDDGGAPSLLGDRLICDAAKFRRDGILAGDTYVIVGNTTGCSAFPVNFGNTNYDDSTPGKEAETRQTVPDPVDPSFSSAVIISDARGMNAVKGATGTRAPVRVDVLIFRNYDSRKTPSDNKKPIAHRVSYVLPPR